MKTHRHHFKQNLFLLGIIFSALCLKAQVTYPNLVGIVSPSDHPLPPGGGVFQPPVNNSAPAAEAPEFAEIIRIGDPNNVLPFTGSQLSKYNGPDFGKDCRYTVFGQTSAGDSTLADAQILRLDSLNGAIILPKNMPQDAMYLVWPGNNSGYGRPLAINQTELDWLGPNQASPGDTISAFGRNLCRYKTTHVGTNPSWVYIKPFSGSGMWATVINSNPYKVDFAVPASLTPGKYEVWLHNGRGGNYGWSGPDTLTIVSPTIWTSTVFNVKSFGATGNGSTDDGPAILLAFNAAASSPYSTVYFPTGNYMVTTSLYPRSNTRINGDGMNLSRIRWGGTSPNYLIESSGGDNNIEIQNIALDASDTGTVNGVQAIYARTVSDWHFNNVCIKGIQLGSNYLANLNDFSLSQRIFLKNCVLIGGDNFMGATKQIFFDSCRFYQTNDVSDCLQPWGTNGLCANNCITQDYNDADTNGWGDGRFVTANLAWGSQRNTYFGNITTVNMGPRNVPWLDQNTGEQFNSEVSQTTNFYGHPVSSTLTNVTLSGTLNPNALIGNTLVIIGGKGLGQYRAVTGLSGETVTVYPPFNLAPDSTSYIIITPYYEKTVMYNNNINGKITDVTLSNRGGRAGIELWGASLGTISDNNTIHQASGALVVTAQGTNDALSLAATYFNICINNKIRDCRAGVVLEDGDYADTNGRKNTKGLFGNVFRNNTVIDSSGYCLYAYSGTSVPAAPAIQGTADMNIYDSDTSKGIPIGVTSYGKGALNTIYYNNTVNGADTGIDFSQGVLPDLRDNTYTGCTLNYSGTLPGAILEAPYRVFLINVPANGTGTVKVPVWDGGTSPLTWDALVNVNWLSYTPILNTVNSENLTDTILVSCNASALPNSPDTAYMTLTAGSQVKKVTIIAKLDLSAGLSPAPKTVLSSVSIYPNPNNGNFTLSLSNSASICTIEVYSILGEKIFTETLPQSQPNNTINLTNQPNGVYFYRVLKDDGNLIGNGKLIIQH